MKPNPDQELQIVEMENDKTNQEKLDDIVIRTQILEEKCKKVKKKKKN